MNSIKKKMFFALIVWVQLCYGQQPNVVNQVPAKVSATFQQLYPNAANVSWQEEQGYFIPVFLNNNVQTKLLIDVKGALVHTFVKIAATAMPAAANTYIATNYAGNNITDAEQITMINHTTRYEAIVGGKDLIFDANGKFITTASGPLKQ